MANLKNETKEEVKESPLRRAEKKTQKIVALGMKVTKTVEKLGLGIWNRVPTPGEMQERQRKMDDLLRNGPRANIQQVQQQQTPKEKKEEDKGEQHHIPQVRKPKKVVTEYY